MTAEQIAFRIQYATVDSGGEADPSEAAERVLRDHRVLGAIRGGADVPTLLIPLTDHGTVVTLDDDGALAFGLGVADLQRLFDEAGLTLHLEHPEAGVDELDAELDDEFGAAFEELDDEARLDEGEAGLAGFGMPGDGDDLPDEPFAVEPVRVAEFSRRGPWAARITAQILNTAVEYLEAGTWSLYRYRTDQPHMLLTGGRADGVVIEVNLPQHGEAWIEVTAPGGGTGMFWPNAERLTRPVLEIDAITAPASAEVYRRMLADFDGTRDELAELALGSDVDIETAHRACMPEAVGGVEGEDERLRAFVAAFGVPAELIALGLTDGAAHGRSRRFAPRGWMPTAGDLLLGGIPEFAPLTRRDRPVVRAAQALRERPLLGAALSTAELTAGLALTRGRSGLGRALGVLAVIDAAADLVLWTVRMRRR